MGFKIRGYTRTVPQDKVRDYSLFAIACEGTEREPDYFRLFDGIDRIKVDIIDDVCSRESGVTIQSRPSSPSHVLERVLAYMEEYQLDAKYGDTLWCVIDKDRWPQEQIEELYNFCSGKKNCFLTISNPCIEVWLLYHKLEDLSELDIHSAQDAKKALGDIEPGGYYYIKYLPLMLQAIINAKKADSNPNGYLPGFLQTKVYHLAEALYARMGKVRFEKFVASLPDLEREILARKGVL